MKKSTHSHHIYIDPVCFMKVDPVTKDYTYTHQMHTYYFCAEACRKAFEANPDKYLMKSAPKRQGWWQRYLKRLNKATGGKPPKCCD